MVWWLEVSAAKETFCYPLYLIQWTLSIMPSQSSRCFIFLAWVNFTELLCATFWRWLKNWRQEAIVLQGNNVIPKNQFRLQLCHVLSGTWYHHSRVFFSAAKVTCDQSPQSLIFLSYLLTDSTTSWVCSLEYVYDLNFFWEYHVNEYWKFLWNRSLNCKLIVVYPLTATRILVSHIPAILVLSVH